MAQATKRNGERRIVSMDIGGTHARFCIATFDAEHRIQLGDVVTIKTADHGSFESAWKDFEQQSGGTLPRGAAMSLAGPVGDPGDANRVIRFTNNPWVIRPGQLPQALGLDALTVVNDFAAVGYAVALADAEHFLHLSGPDGPLPGEGTISVLGPGTGLGVAHIWRASIKGGLAGHAHLRGAYHVQATEGGHLDFAPLDSFEDALLARLRQRYRRVSTERVVSGPALVDIYETLAALEKRPITVSDDKTLWGMAADGDMLAGAAAQRFCLSLGSVAGDIALAQGACGVVIAGGLGYRIREMLLASGFAARFRAKGRFEGLMASLPVKLITHPQPGLFGAAAAFAREHFHENDTMEPA